MNRDWLTLAFGIALVGAVVVVTLRHNLPHDDAAPAPTPAASTSPAPTSPAPAPGGPAPAAPTGPRIDRAAPTASSRARNAAPAAPVAEAPAPAPSGVILHVQSDVAGASVFLDREFVGTTPLTLRDLTPGSKRLNVTAEGQEGYVDTVRLTEGTNRVNVEFRKVRLNASVPVVHKHGMGSCDGTLSASVKGLVFTTDNKGDAFTVGFDEVDQFEVDYLKKNLRIRKRGGKTWNFTNADADSLFVFHRDVAKAREKLAAR